jgi:hypothetical protein
MNRFLGTILLLAAVVTAALTNPAALRSQSAPPGSVLLSDQFGGAIAEGWTISPLGQMAGWTVTGGTYRYDGRGDAQSYRGDPSWTDYTVEVSIALVTLGDSPGGLRGRVDPTTGGGYAVWLYPATGQIWLTRTTGWRIDAPGSTELAVAGGISFDTATAHTIRLTFAGSLIQVYYDGNLVIRANDTAYRSGVIALDGFTQPVVFDNVTVTSGVVTELLRDGFDGGLAAGWTPSPLGRASGWAVVDGSYSYDGGGHTQSYRGDPAWNDYTLDANIQLATMRNFPGGVRGRVQPETGAGYAVWLYPEFGQIRLVRAAAWSIDAPGMTVLATAGGMSFDTQRSHALRVTFAGTAIRVYWDGVLVIRAVDTTLRTGVIALDVSDQPVRFDDVAVTYGALPERFSSGEPGCDGSDPNVVMCDDFEDGVWYRTNCDNGGVTDAANDGWCGTIYKPIEPVDAAVCGAAGAAGTNCAATSGFSNGAIGGQMMADHSFRYLDEFEEIYARYYYKAADGYIWGWQKAMTWNQCCAGIGRIKWGNLHFPCVGALSCAPSVQLPVPEDVMQGQNLGNPLTFLSGRWYFIEVHMQLNTVGQADGVVEVWLDDCGRDGLGCAGTPTRRLRRTDVRFNRQSPGEKIGSIWWENWANPGSTGMEYYDQVKVATVGPIGFAPIAAGR